MLVRIWPRLARGGAHTKAWSRILGASLATVMISVPTAASVQASLSTFVLTVPTTGNVTSCLAVTSFRFT